MPQGRLMDYRPILFILLNFLDWLITCIILSYGGIEVMPISKYIINNFGLPGLLIFKVLVSIAIIYLLNIFNMHRLYILLNTSLAIICGFGLITVVCQTSIQYLSHS